MKKTTFTHKTKLALLSALLINTQLFALPTLANELGATPSKTQEEKSEGTIALSKAQLTLANIQVEALQPQIMTYSVYAPGEIQANDYKSYLVSPRVDSVIVKRHVALGDHVKKGQALVTLFSESVADAQARYQIANAEWQRVQKLGRKAVGDKRYIAAQTDYQADVGRLLAFGLSEQSIAALTTQKSKLGEYVLNAMTSGAVLSDNFRQGQRVLSGDTLIELADESSLWVEARLAPSMQVALPEGSKAVIEVGNKSYLGHITQKAHTIDPQTRTRTVRLTVDNIDDQLHSGLFVDVYFNFTTTEQVLAVPESALMRSSDGDWQVFIEQNGSFKGQEIELGRTFTSANDSSIEKWHEIKGIEAGTNVVTAGAFYVSAEIAKGGFDAHGH
ncbi:efflux RND transporter periplasmic adaptor subunit [Neptunicella sp.]|uniref:efflux RND transporter periplasmic adaptor subunit n=1 Tax=Neptunicella sp. TaxID=2125986 RepID=UPI003F692941